MALTIAVLIGASAEAPTAKHSLAAAIAASASEDTILARYHLYPLTSAIVLTGDRHLSSDDGTHTTWETAAAAAAASTSNWPPPSSRTA